MKLRMHRKFCSKPPRGFNEIRVPKKATTLREEQLNEAERMGSVHQPGPLRAHEESARLISIQLG